MDTNKMREQFEAAYVEEMVARCGEGFRSTVLHSLTHKNPYGEYFYVTDSIAWWGWKASRLAEAVDLSDLSNCFSPNDCGDRAMWVDDVKKLIEAQGLKVKP